MASWAGRGEPKAPADLDEGTLLLLRCHLLTAPAPIMEGFILDVGRAERWMAKYRAWYDELTRKLGDLYRPEGW